MGIPIPDGGVAGVQTGFDPLPNGTYLVEVTDGDVRQAGEEAKYPGSTYIAWEMTVQDEEYLGRKCWINTSLTPNAKPLLRAFLEAVGYSENDLENPEFEIEVEEIVGKQLKAVLTKGINPKTKEPNNSVRRVLPLDDNNADLPG